MPTPREAYVNTVDRQGFSGARVQAADYGASGQIVARAAQGFGQDLQRVGQDLDDIQTIYAQAAAKDALVQALPRLSAVKQGYAKLEKGDAIGAQANAVADIDTVEREIAGQLKDARAQRMFRDAFLDRKMSALEAIGNHEQREVLAYDKDRSIALRDTALDQAADSYGDEAEMMVHLDTAASVEAGLRKGAAPEEIAAAKAQVRSVGLAKAWSQIQDPLAKEAFRQKHSGMIDPDTEAKLINSNAAGLFDARGDLIEADFFKSAATSVTPTEPGQGEPPAQMASAKVNPVVGKDYSPVGRAGRRGQGAREHAARGSDNKGIDFAAPAGTPIRPPTSGKVASTGYNDSNGHFIRVAYDNGYTGIFLHLKGPPPLRDGDTVDPGTIIGAVGSTGKSSGNHVHYSVRGPDGNYVDPDTIRYDGVERPRYKAQDVDTAAVYDKAYAYAEAKNLTPRETEQLLKRIDVRANRERALQSDAERVADRAAEEAIDTLGKNYTQEGQVSLDGTSLETRRQARAIREANTKPPAVDPHTETWRTLRDLKEDDPAAFATVNVRGLAITEGQKTAALAEQAKLRNKDGTLNDAAVDNYTRVRDVAARYVPRLPGIKGSVNENPEREKRDRYIASVERRIEKRIADNGGKDISLREYDQIAAEEAMTVYVNGKALPKFEAEGVPRSQMRINRIDAAKIVWRKMYPGRPYPSDAELAAMAE